MKLSRFFTIAICLFAYCAFATAQDIPVQIEGSFAKSVGKAKKGDRVTISSVEHVLTPSQGSVTDSYVIHSSIGDFSTNDVKEKNFIVENKVPNDVWNSAILWSVLPNLEKKGIQNELRRDMEEDALNYINRVEQMGLELQDPWLENYLYSLVSKIAPTTFVDGRPGNVNLVLIEDPDLNACMYPNGTLVISSGLIAVLHSEDELVGILAHEIAHFVLDHSVQNINAKAARQKRAEFWAGLATVLTAVGEVAVSAKNEYYVPGAATMAMAVTAYTIASELEARLGMKYNNEQELEADSYAKMMLELLGYSPQGLAVALNRLETVMLEERSKAMFFSSYSHPSLLTRIQEQGLLSNGANIDNKEFEQRVSFAVTSAARMKYAQRRFRQALPLVTQNINNGVGTSEDYVIKAGCLLSLQTDEASNKDALSLLAKARQLDPNNINIFKNEIVAYLRMSNYSSALSCIDKYEDALSTMAQRLASINNGSSWDNANSFIESETDWCARMKIKINGMK